MTQETDTTSERTTSPKQGNQWSSLRSLVLRLHFYAGVFVAPFIAVAAVTGLLYVWTPQIEQALYADQLRVEPTGQTLPLSEQVRIAQAELPGAELDAVRPATTGEDSTRVLFDAPEEPNASYRNTVFVDPHDGEVLGVMQTYGSSGALPARAWISNMHRNLHLGDAGRLYSEFAASWMWVVALGGLALWVSRTRRVRGGARRLLVPGAGARKGYPRSLSVHGATGLWILVGLLFLSATGMTWSQYAGANISDLRQRLDWTTPSVSTELPESVTSAPGADAGIDAVLATAREADLDGPVEVVPPAEAGSSYLVKQVDLSWPTGADSAAIDPATAEIVDVLRFDDYPVMAKLTSWGIAAHMGLLFGLPNQLVLSALIAGLLAVLFLGYRMWWQRRPTRTRALGVGRPYPRGAFRELSLPLKIAVVAVLALVGWAVPMLGVSLLLFLAIDVALGWRARRSAEA
ncbi:PepSY-associated TM helix domain-containing protein [Nocardiopsis sp. LOL_012]|uniref:PepSY-associated TM helix domain-containing protein n=1 Tax=Nocardiopsis sp. LOL_012 TaxID=3345409 RepID=UPI003A8BF136